VSAGFANVVPGDICVLASGGPVMTATSYTDKENDFMYCSWFEHGKLRRETFAVAALRRAETPAIDEGQH
jgi:uncharacterized protein YodC (DUF2158 family)